MDDTIAALKSNGIAFRNCPSGVAPLGRSTIIVVGVARSGTSMVAKTLRELGVFIGAKADQAVHEDVEIARALETRDLEALRRLVSERDGKHDVWGFKRPGAYKLIDRFVQHFRNPRFVITFRDPVAIAKRNEISMQMDFMKALHLAVHEMGELVYFVDRLKQPAMLVSYEKALLNPEAFVSNLVEFCGISISPDLARQAAAAIENGPARYLNSSRLRFEGKLDRVSDGVAYGWARRVGQDKPQIVLVKHGERIVGRGLANRFRKDLAEIGKGAGQCAFEIELEDNELTKEDVTVEIEGSSFKIKK